jgi:hypothetical protein
MTTDNPYEPPTGGFEEADEFDVAIARQVMRTTWGSAAGALGLAVGSLCCNPFMIVGLLAIGAGLNALLRIATMDSELRRLIPVSELAAAAVVASLGMLVGAGGMLLALISILLR